MAGLDAYTYRCYGLYIYIYILKTDLPGAGLEPLEAPVILPGVTESMTSVGLKARQSLFSLNYKIQGTMRQVWHRVMEGSG